MKWAVGFFVICLSACVSGPKPHMDLAPKTEMGFSFLPPQTAGWSQTKPSRQVYAYGKAVDGVDKKKHSIVFAVHFGSIDTGLTKAQEILNFVKMEKQTQLQGLRFDVQKDRAKFVTFKGAQCLEFDSRARDKQVHQDMTLTGLFCLHPEDHKRYVDISYSQRHDLNRADQDIYAEGEDFVRSVTFLPLPKSAQTP